MQYSTVSHAEFSSLQYNEGYAVSQVPERFNQYFCTYNV